MLNLMKKQLLSVPEELIKEVRKINGAPTKSKAVVIALEEYIREFRLNRMMNRMGKGFGMTVKELIKLREEE